MIQKVDVLEIKDSKIPVIINQEIYDKIEYVCKLIPNVEWSGAVLYVIEGSIKDVKTMKIIVKDIIVMVKSSSTYTKFTFNEKKREGINVDRHMDYCMENEEALNWKIGFIHSHNTFGTFFSGTDNEELIENSEAHNYYFSLITNNAMELIARVATRIKLEKVITAAYVGIDENGEDYNFFEGEFEIKKEKVAFIDCEVNFPSRQTSVNPSFLKNVEEVIKEAEKPKSITTPLGRGTHYNEYDDDIRFNHLRNMYQNGSLDEPNAVATIGDMYNDDAKKIFVKVITSYFNLRYAKDFKMVIDYLVNNDRVINNEKFAEIFGDEYEKVCGRDYMEVSNILDEFEEISLDFNLGDNLLIAIRSVAQKIFE